VRRHVWVFVVVGVLLVDVVAIVFVVHAFRQTAANRAAAAQERIAKRAPATGQPRGKRLVDIIAARQAAGKPIRISAGYKAMVIEWNRKTYTDLYKQSGRRDPE